MPSIAVRRACFLEVLRSTANVSRAARESGLASSMVYGQRSRNAAFAQAWDLALAEALDGVEETMIARARDGVEKPVFFRGEQVGAIRQYSDALGMFILRAKRPEVYARIVVDAPARLPDEMTEAEARVEVERRLDRLRDDQDQPGGESE